MDGIWVLLAVLAVVSGLGLLFFSHLSARELSVDSKLPYAIPAICCGVILFFVVAIAILHSATA